MTFSLIRKFLKNKQCYNVLSEIFARVSVLIRVRKYWWYFMMINLA